MHSVHVAAARLSAVLGHELRACSLLGNLSTCAAPRTARSIATHQCFHTLRALHGIKCARTDISALVTPVTQVSADPDGPRSRHDRHRRCRRSGAPRPADSCPATRHGGGPAVCAGDAAARPWLAHRGTFVGCAQHATWSSRGTLSCCARRVSSSKLRLRPSPARGSDAAAASRMSAWRATVQITALPVRLAGHADRGSRGVAALCRSTPPAACGSWSRPRRRACRAGDRSTARMRRCGCTWQSDCCGPSGDGASTCARLMLPWAT